MKIAAIIPSRYNSTRFRGKPLVKIDGISMIERVYTQVKKSNRFSDIIVATDNKRIAQVVQQFGGKFVMTSEKHRSGTERLWEVMDNNDYDAAINIQGDEPLISEHLISELYDQLKTGHYEVITAAWYNTSLDDYSSKDVVKVVFDKDFRVLYFSRSPLPFVDESEFIGFYQHVGIYGYLKGTIESFVNAPISELERMEKLEQLRFLENNISVKVIVGDYKSFGVDIPEDITKIEKILKNINR